MLNKTLKKSNSERTSSRRTALLEKDAHQVAAPKSGAITIADVARVAGVTQAMVSMTLSGKRANTPAADAVWRAARELDYQPNPHAQRLASGRCTGMVPVFSLYLDLGVGAQKIQTMQTLLTEAGMQVPLHTCGYGAHDGASRELMNDLRLQKPQALICDLQDLNPAAMGEIEQFIRGGNLVVTYDYAHEMPCDHVVFDREENTYQAARHLLELGHTRIGLAHHMVFHETHLSQRQIGFSRALFEFGVEQREEWNFTGKSAIDYSAGGREIARQFLAMPVSQRPSALCIINDYAALSFITEVRRAGLNVPDDVSVVGHDDLPMVEHAAVPLTTAAHPAQEIAQQTVALLQSRLDGSYDGPPREVVLRGELQIRQSTAAFK